MTAEKVNGIDVPALRDFAANVRSDPRKGVAGFNVTTRWDGQTKSTATVSHYSLGGKRIARHFQVLADEPLELLGEDTAPNPQELLLSALNACMTVGYAANAAVMGIMLTSLEIETEGVLDLRGFLGLDPAVKPGYAEVRYTVRIKSPAPRAQLEELHRTVMKTSPNFSNFATAITMIPNLVIETA